MRKISEIISIIKEIKNLKNDTDIARVLEMKQSAFSERKRTDSIPFEQIAIFCKKENISFDWLVLGKEEEQPDKTFKEVGKKLEEIKKLLNLK